MEALIAPPKKKKRRITQPHIYLLIFEFSSNESRSATSLVTDPLPVELLLLNINEEELYDIENAFKKWQFAHMKTVERILGNKRGTGGTSGVTYLKRAVDEPLWDSVK